MNFLLQSSTLGGTAILTRLAFSMGLSLIVALVYHRTYVGYGRPSQLSIVLVLISMTISGIIMAIGENLALSLGMVGALSIVRFRSAVKENRDLAYLFWSIATGLVCGAGNFLLAIVLMCSIGLIVFLMEKIDFFQVVSKKYILILTRKVKSEDTFVPFPQILPPDSVHKASSYNEQSGTEESTYLVDLKTSSAVESLKRRLVESSQVLGFQIITPEDSALA